MKTQNERLLAEFKQGIAITPLAALRALGIMRLSARVGELRDQGHAINSRLIEVGGKRVAEYSMEACA